MATVTDCPNGKYCPASAVSGTLCPIGTYYDILNAKALTDCKQCKGGYYCATTGLAAPTALCSAGYFCTQGANFAAPTLLAGSYGPCPTGQYCPSGSAAGTPCLPGTYNPSTG